MTDFRDFQVQLSAGAQTRNAGTPWKQPRNRQRRLHNWSRQIVNRTITSSLRQALQLTARTAVGLWGSSCFVTRRAGQATGQSGEAEITLTQIWPARKLLITCEAGMQWIQYDCPLGAVLHTTLDTPRPRRLAPFTEVKRVRVP